MDAAGVANIISGFALLVAVIALYVSAKASSRSEALQHASVEIEVRASIDVSRARVEDLSITHSPLLAKDKATLTAEEATYIDIVRKVFDSAIENNVNAYENACQKYVDKKIDRVRFKKAYQTEIRQLVESSAHKRFFDGVTSRYKAILLVYGHWENKERLA